MRKSGGYLIALLVALGLIPGTLDTSFVFVAVPARHWRRHPAPRRRALAFEAFPKAERARVGTNLSPLEAT
jgi:hypothetical protein